MDQPTVTVQAKPWYASRALWLNFLGLLVLVIGVVLDNAKLVDLPTQVMGALGMALAVANAVLRFSTNAPLGASPDSTAEVPAPPRL